MCIDCFNDGIHSCLRSLFKKNNSESENIHNKSLTHDNKVSQNIPKINDKHIIYHRQTIAGLGSHLVLLCDNLNNDHPKKMRVDISLSNYKCEWNELFDVDIVEGEKKTSLYDRISTTMYNRSTYDIKLIKEWHECWDKYIRPKKEILISIDRLCEKYPIKTSTCLYFRGSDKKIEVDRIAYDVYLKHIPELGPIYVQSDEVNFINFVKELYPDRVYSISEFTHNTDSSPLHLRETTNKNDAIEILSIMYLMARSKVLICNISNVTQVALIIRGNTDGYICVQ